ncbi:MAG: site-specific DNA-methyltransferase [Eubacteriales bacterium]
MKKLRMETKDMTQENIRKLAELFPNVVTEMKDENGKLKMGINFELLKQELSDDVVDGEECYEFTWVGKRAAMVEANKPILKTLRPCMDESKNWESTENIYIEGDNLDALKLLQESYLNSVKMIYIDPPYNTGNDSFVYSDDYSMDQEEIDEEMQYRDEEGNINFRKNTDTNPRFHSDWCSMMYPRLKLARNLLKDDGVIFISIDDGEAHNLKKICDEVFGEHHFIAELVWQKKTGAADATHFAIVTEYILAYGKNAHLVRLNRNTEAHDDKRYRHVDEYLEERGPFYYDNLDRGTLGYIESLDFGIETPDGTLAFPNGRTRQFNDGWRWKWGQEKVKWGLDNGFIELREAPSKECGWSVYYKIYMNVDNEGRKIVRSSPYKNLLQGILNTHAANEAKELFGRTGIFSNPKPVELISFLVDVSTNIHDHDIILDFFAGSSTTAHAIMQLNAEDGGNRKFIMVQLPEATEEKSDAFKAGYKTISDIGKERIRRAGEKIKAEIEEANAKLDEGEEPKQVPDIGFRVFKVDSTNMKEIYYPANAITQEQLWDLESNIKEDRTDLDLLYGVMVDWGLKLSLRHEMETIEGVKVHTVDHGALIACFAENVPEKVVREIARRQPLRVVFRDSSFSSSPEKINVEEIFKLLSPNTSVRVI